MRDMGACNYYEIRKNRKTVRKVRKMPAVYCMESCKDCATLKKKTVTTTDRCMCKDQKQNNEARKEKASLSICDNTDQLRNNSVQRRLMYPVGTDFSGFAKEVTPRSNPQTVIPK